MTIEEIKELHKNDTAIEALDYLHRLSVIYVKPRSVEEKFRRLLRDKVEKHLKALEIIKEKNVNVLLIIYAKSNEVYNTYIFNKDNELTQEDFNLLKEVFDAKE